MGNDYTINGERTDRRSDVGVDAYIDNIDMGNGVEHKHVEKTHIESYTMYTNLKIVQHEDAASGMTVPGLFDLLMEHQDNDSYPYTVTKVCVRYNDKNGNKQKKAVSFDKVAPIYNRKHINMWMLEVCGGDNSQDKFVIRFWNKVNNRSESRLEVAVFPKVSFGQGDDMVYESVDAMDDRFTQFINPAIYGDNVDDDDDVYDDQDDPTYETPGYQQPPVIRPPEPSTNTGIVPMNQGSPYDIASAARSNDEGTGTSSIVRSAISFVLFGIQAFIAYMITHVGTITIAFGVLAVLSLVTLIVSIAKHSARVNGKPVSIVFPKVMSTILIIIAIIELVALAAVLVMYKMHALPGPLQFLYTTL